VRRGVTQRGLVPTECVRRSDASQSCALSRPAAAAAAAAASAAAAAAAAADIDFSVGRLAVPPPCVCVCVWSIVQLPACACTPARQPAHRARLRILVVLSSFVEPGTDAA